MLRDKDSLLTMLPQYEASPLVGEILLIDNIGFDYKWTFKKIRVLNDGNNLFVNPSWNLGVREAKFDKIIIANDDIVFRFDTVIEKVDEYLQVGMICGFSVNCFAQKRNGTPLVSKLQIIKHISKRAYGFGVFMILFKETYFPIPDEFKVWYGDSILHAKHEAYLIEGINVITKMQQTTSFMKNELKSQKSFEKIYWQQYQKSL